MNKTVQVDSSSSTNKKNITELDPYRQPTKQSYKSRKSKASFDSSLPFIAPYADTLKYVKVNEIRREAEGTQEQITLMKARIHALKEMKYKYEFKKQKSLQKIQFLQTIRDRKQFQSLQKLKEKQKQNKQIEDLKEKAKSIRQNLKNEISKARQTIYVKNHETAEYQKYLQNEFSSQIQSKEQRQIQQNRIKKMRIKEIQSKHSQKIKQFQQSRVKFAESNHMTRAYSWLKERQTKEKSLKKLKEEQYKLVDEVKRLQKEYDETTQKLNPETKLKGSRASIARSHQHIEGIKQNMYDI